MEPLKIRVDYSRDDFLRGLTFMNNRSWMHRHSALIAAASVFVLLLLFIISLRDASDIASPILLIAAAAVPALAVGCMIYFLSRVLNPWFLRRSIEKQISTSPILQEVNEIEFNETGLAGSTFLGSTSTKWAAFIEAAETETDFYFFTSTKFSYFVPKAAFSDVSDIERLRTLVKDKLGDRAKLIVEE